MGVGAGRGVGGSLRDSETDGQVEGITCRSGVHLACKVPVCMFLFLFSSRRK